MLPGIQLKELDALQYLVCLLQPLGGIILEGRRGDRNADSANGNKEAGPRDAHASRRLWL